MERLDTIKTDPRTARNIVGRIGRTGYLEGRREGVLFGDDFDAEAPVLDIVTNVVLGMLLQRAGDLIITDLIAFFEGRGLTHGAQEKKGNYDKSEPRLAYKGRSLSGVWATAPFLHNGSVPSLSQLLKKPEDRMKTFFVGSRKFDPEEVGLQYKTASPISFEFRTHDDEGKPIPGNSNAGHEHGTGLKDGQKRDLIEYMKTAMGPVK